MQTAVLLGLAIPIVKRFISWTLNRKGYCLFCWTTSTWLWKSRGGLDPSLWISTHCVYHLYECAHGWTCVTHTHGRVSVCGLMSYLSVRHQPEPEYKVLLDVEAASSFVIPTGAETGLALTLNTWHCQLYFFLLFFSLLLLIIIY